VSGDGYVVPWAMRDAMFVRHQPGQHRAPVRVTRRAFELAGIPVPENRGQQNIYQLTERRGEPWTPALDRHVCRFSAELLGRGDLVCIDCDQHLAIDGTVWRDGLRWLTDTGAAAGHLLDITCFVAVRTPGDPGRRHGMGWHLWGRTDPEYPIQYGALKDCPAVEIKSRATAPGSPGYDVRYAPAKLPVIPRWIAELAGPPRPVLPPAATTGTCSPAQAWRRMCGMVNCLAAKRQPGRNDLLFVAGALAGELGIEFAVAEMALLEAARRNGLVADDGADRCRATIRNGYTAGSGTSAVAHA
jgi:hypothetical protein